VYRFSSPPSKSLLIVIIRQPHAVDILCGIRLLITLLGIIIAGMAQKAEHSGHTQHHEGTPRKNVSVNRLALSATIHCLTGCAIGEVLGLVIGTALNWNNAPSIALSVVLAFFFGYSLTLAPLVISGMPWRTALSLALASDTLSITVMEIVDNAIMLVVPGAMTAGLSSLLFWGTLVLSLAVAFVAALPVNRWLIRLGRGHALVHASHQK
jgi:hypothetical protein